MTQPSRISIIVLLLWGKIRRFLLCVLSPGSVRRAIEKRLGACIRCGTCCRLPFKCSFLKADSSGTLGCSVYPLRPPNCRVFPVDGRDIRERDLIAGGRACGYSFKTPGSKTGNK